MTRNILITSLLIILLIIAAAWYFISRESVQKITIDVGATPRQFLLYVPPGVQENPGVLFVLHGAGLDAAQMRRATGLRFEALADANSNMLVVYPQGMYKTWNDCRKIPASAAKAREVDDIGFFAEMIAYLTEKHAIDYDEIFVTGFSDGGRMTYRLARERPDLFKGFAVISASHPVRRHDDCADTFKPVSILIMNGTDDKHNPYYGGTIQSDDGLKGGLLSTNETLHFWNALAQTNIFSRTRTSLDDHNPGDQSVIVRYGYDRTKHGKDVVLNEVINGGHTIPMRSSHRPAGSDLGRVNRDFDAPDLIYEFFMQLE